VVLFSVGIVVTVVTSSACSGFTAAYVAHGSAPYRAQAVVAVPTAAPADRAWQESLYRIESGPQREPVFIDRAPEEKDKGPMFFLRQIERHSGEMVRLPYGRRYEFSA
jgi:hypothetical protein